MLCFKNLTLSCHGVLRTSQSMPMRAVFRVNCGGTFIWRRYSETYINLG
jgi:hypothetical protein